MSQKNLCKLGVEIGHKFKAEKILKQNFAKKMEDFVGYQSKQI